MNHRLRAVAFAFIICLFLVVFKLYYWQVLKSDELSRSAKNQYSAAYAVGVSRGTIRSSDNFPLVTNKLVYTLAVDPTMLEDTRRIFSDVLPIVLADTPTLSRETLAEKWRNLLKLRDSRWIPLSNNLSSSTAEEVGKLAISGLILRSGLNRDYPEASIAASLVGIVAGDKDGNPKGYFGLEGYYNRELEGHPGLVNEEKDARGQPILLGKFQKSDWERGRDLVLHIDRGAQFISQRSLADGLERYGASEGSVIVMDPKNGAILAMVSLPTYDPNLYASTDSKLFLNGAVAKSFEPGSIFKPIMMAIALSENVITPETLCDRCSGPWKVGEYWIRTWNEKYFPQETMTDVIIHSDNVGMTFVADKIGPKKMLHFFEKFGIGQATEIDLEDEDFIPIREENNWSPIDYAAASFGQGIALTPIQMIRAIAVIANKGIMVEPHIVSKIIGVENEKVIKPKILGRIISEDAARMTTEMMVLAVDRGEAKWTSLKGFRIAGKTGTAQIPVGGKYDQKKINASFVGFIPAENPKFIMLVTLHNPQSSSWAAETAAPLWFSLANKLITYWGVANFR